MLKKIETIENTIKDILISSCNNSLIAFKEENRISNKDPDNLNSDNEDPAPLLVGDETNKEMPYTQDATIRTHFLRLKKFIKLVDYLILNSKIQLINNSSESLSKSIQKHNEECHDSSKQIKLSTWLICQISNKRLELEYYPNQEQSHKCIEELVNKGLQRVCNKHKQLIHLQDLAKFTKYDDGDGDEDNNEEVIDIQTIIYNDENFKNSCQRIRGLIDIAFGQVIQFSKFLQPFLEIYYKNIKTLENIKELENFDVEDFKNALVTYKNQDADFQAMESKTELGIYMFDNSNLKENIKNCAFLCLNEVQKMLPQLCFSRAKSFVIDLSELNQKLNWTASETPSQFVQQFVQFNDNVNKISLKLDQYTEKCSDISALLLLIIDFKIKISEVNKNKVNESQQIMGSLRKKIEESMASYDQNLTKCQKKLEKIIPDLNEKIKDYSEKIENSDVANRNADIGKTVQFLEEMQIFINEISESSQKVNKWQMQLNLEPSQFEKIEDF